MILIPETCLTLCDPNDTYSRNVACLTLCDPNDTYSRNVACLTLCDSNDGLFQKRGMFDFV